MRSNKKNIVASHSLILKLIHSSLSSIYLCAKYSLSSTFSSSDHGLMPSNNIICTVQEIRANNTCTRWRAQVRTSQWCKDPEVCPSSTDSSLSGHHAEVVNRLNYISIVNILSSRIRIETILTRVNNEKCRYLYLHNEQWGLFTSNYNVAGTA